MTTVYVQVENQLGLHARPAAKLVDCACRYQSQIHFEYNSQRIDGKSIMSVMMLAAPYGARLLLDVVGEDEADAINAISNLFVTGFGEL